MRAIFRGAATTFLTVGALWAAAASATADPTSSGCPDSAGYVPGAGCVVQVIDIRTVCDSTGAGRLVYSLTAPGAAVDVTISDGRHSATATGPLDGSVLWPSEVNAATATVTFTTQTDTGATYTVSAGVPSPVCSEVLPDDPSTTGPTPDPDPVSTPTPDPTPRDVAPVDSPSGSTSSDDSQTLAQTGSQAGPLAGVAAGLVLVGGLVYLASRRTA
jgi:LPXTG-motif cell wall-anchored protein